MRGELAPRRRGGIVLERSIRTVDGTLMLRQRFVGDDTRILVTHDAALRSRVEIRSGALGFGAVIAPQRFVLAVPPRSVVAIRFAAAEIDSDGPGAVHPLDDHAAPALELDDGRVIALDPDAGAPPAIARARAALHDAIAAGAPAPVRLAAARIGVAPETLTRAFARAYGLAPKQYCHRARLFDAAIRLFTGSSVLDAALRAGFNDLTRFYVQFRRLLGGTPGEYARIRKRQDAGAAPA